MLRRIDWVDKLELRGKYRIAGYNELNRSFIIRLK